MIALVGARPRQGPFAPEGVHLAVPAKTYAVMRGRSGAGKTTLLEVIAGLRSLASGRVLLDGRDVTDEPPEARRVGYVPQERALFPTLKVYDQLAFGPVALGWPTKRIQDRVSEIASRVGVTGLLDRLPAGLSGGESARVALGRALAHAPAVLLLDEPLAGLDEEAADDLMGLLREVRDARLATVLHVTHSAREADALAEVRLHVGDGVVRPN